MRSAEAEQRLPWLAPVEIGHVVWHAPHATLLPLLNMLALQVVQTTSVEALQGAPPTPLLPCPAGQLAAQAWHVSEEPVLKLLPPVQAPQMPLALAVQLAPAAPLVPVPEEQLVLQDWHDKNVPLFHVVPPEQAVHWRSADAEQATESP